MTSCRGVYRAYKNHKKLKRLRWQGANHGCHCFDRTFLLVGACVCCVKISFTCVDAAADVTLYNNSNCTVDDVRRLEPRATELTTDLSTHHCVYLHDTTFSSSTLQSKHSCTILDMGVEAIQLMYRLSPRYIRRQYFPPGPQLPSQRGASPLSVPGRVGFNVPHQTHYRSYRERFYGSDSRNDEKTFLFSKHYGDI